MEFVFSAVLIPAPARLVFQAIVVSLSGIALLLGFILARRAWRRRYFRRRDALARRIREQWEGILSGAVPAERWFPDRMQRELVEEILLDQLETARGAEALRLVRCVKVSGLLDHRISEARMRRGWKRRHVLTLLGRMRVPEAIPALAEALDDGDPQTRLAAVRGLGRLGLPEAAEPILERLMEGRKIAPFTPVQNALLSTARWRPSMLVPYLRRAGPEERALLARVLGEVATGEEGDALLLLAFDDQAEVRASAARSLAETRLNTALSALGALAEDDEWFVRLRAVVALGRLAHPRAIPMLVSALCDRNRFVRLRAAMALARLKDQLETIFDLAEEKRDRYGVQALVSELERNGVIFELVDELAGPGRANAERILLRVLRFGAQRMLLSALLDHRQWRVRSALARLLARSGLAELAPPLERAIEKSRSARQKRILGWVLRKIAEGGAAGDRAHLVPVT
jgi:HEAT repeat protein